MKFTCQIIDTISSIFCAQTRFLSQPLVVWKTGLRRVFDYSFAQYRAFLMTETSKDGLGGREVCPVRNLTSLPS